MHTHTYKYTFAHARTHTHAHTHAQTHLHTPIHTHIHENTDTHTHAHTHSHIDENKHACSMRTCMQGSVSPKRTFLRPYNRSKTSKIVGVIAISNEHTSKILGQDLSVRPFLDSNGNAANMHTYEHTHVLAYVHTFIRSLHTYIHTHVYMYIYACMNVIHRPTHTHKYA